MIVIGLVYNHNGMATWCIEMASSLHSQGKEVLLVFDEKQRPDLLQTALPFPTFPFQFNKGTQVVAKGLIGKIADFVLGTFDNRSSGFAYELEKALLEQGIRPRVFLFNQTNLQDDRCQTPQYVVAWAYPTSLWGYLSKTTRQSDSILSLRFLFALSGAISWYRKDWRAYNSSYVMAVSERLTKQLHNKGIKVQHVYPPLNVMPSNFILQHLDTHKIHILMAAIDLENPQKRIPWALEVLSSFPLKDKVQFHLVGSYSWLKERTKAWQLTATFYGLIKREELKEIMAKCDVFVFSSSFDDWGYVQAEALSQGMMVMAPNISPCDEIVGKPEWLFDPSSKDSLLACFEFMIEKQEKTEGRQYALERSALFKAPSLLSQLGRIIS